MGALVCATGWPGPVAAAAWQAPVKVDVGADLEIREQALADLRARRFAAAATGFEALWQAGGQSRDRERAAEARAAAGQLAHALAHWEALSQEPGLAATRRADITRRMSAARRQTTTVPVRVMQAGTDMAIAGATVHVHWVADDGRPAIEVTADAARARPLALDPGLWSLVARAPGHHDVQRVLTVGRAGEGAVVGEVVLALVAIAEPVPTPVPVPTPAPVLAEVAPPSKPAPIDLRLGLGLGLGIAGAAGLGVGIGLLAQHRQGYRHFEAAPDNARFVAALRGSSAGAGLLGAGIGLAVVAATAALVPPTYRRIETVLWAEVAAGGGVALVGAAWYASQWQRVQRDLYDGAINGSGGVGTTTHDVGAQRQETAAAAVIGLGAGLLVGAGVALMTRLLVRRYGARGGSGRGLSAGSPGGPGLQLQGRF